MFAVRVTDETDQPHALDTQDTVKEALVDETLTFASVGGTITELGSYDPEDDSVCDGATFTTSAPGTYRLRCAATNGARQILVRVVPRSVFEAIPDPGLVTGHGHSAARRMVLRSLVNHQPDWDGTAEAFWDNRIKLSNHGVAISP